MQLGWCEMDKTRYWNVCFASLLYGIDEFFNRDAENPSDKSLYIHDLLDEYNGAKLCGFLELEVLKDILHYYADPENNTLTSEAEPYVRIIDTASRLSKKDSNADIGSKVKHEYVHSIFSRLDLGNGFPKPLVYRYVPLEPE